MLPWFLLFGFGIIVGLGMNSLMNNRGNGLGVPLSVIIGGIASLVGGVFLGTASRSVVGVGFDFIVAMIGGPIIAVIAILLVRAIKK